MTTDAKILSALRENPGGVSGAQLAEQLKISRAAVWARIEELRRVGYEYRGRSAFWLSSVSSPDVLHADDLLARLGKTKIIGRDIQVFEQTTSTNDVDGKTRARRCEGRRGRFCRIADERPRTARSQMDFAGAQGLWFSVLLRPAVASAGGDATDRRLGHRAAARDYNRKPV